MRWLIGVLALVTVGSVVWLLLHARGIDLVPDDVAPAAVAPLAEGRAPPRQREPAADRAAAGRSAGTDDFRERVRSFLARAESLSPLDRTASAEALKTKVLEREAAGALLPAESAYLQLSLLRAVVSDPASLRRESAALLERYQEASEAGWQAYLAEPDSRHRAYRAAESELVRAVQAGEIPADELRGRLQDLREVIYADAP